MKIRTRLILSFIFLVGIGFYFLTGYILDYLRPRYLESVEDVLVDQSYMLAGFLETNLKEKALSTDQLKNVFDQVYQRQFVAKIYQLSKTNVDERVYVTDAKGIVLYDSNDGKDVSQDYSQWRNVSRTLQGQYGARTTRLDYNPKASLLHITAPIFSKAGEIIGTVTVSKPTGNINFFMANAKTQVMIAGGIAALSVILLGVVFSIWMTWPLRKLTHYARAVRDGKRVSLPSLGKSEIGEMGVAFEEMREALEGKKYVENYVQTLTHELKSPLAAIQGAAEILEEDISEAQRKQFLGNIKLETSRMKQLVERLLELSSLESRQGLQNVQEMDLIPMIGEILEGVESLIQRKNLKLVKNISSPLLVKGEKFLLQQALLNLVQNAVDFSPTGGTLEIDAHKNENTVSITVKDEGPGIPDYALSKVFEKFYSLPRPDTGKKSSGLGLSFVKEVATLHHGKIEISNQNAGGTQATLLLPWA